MKVTAKILMGATLLTLASTGAVAYASTTNTANTVTSQGRHAYAAQIKSEVQGIKSLNAERRQLNQELKTDWQNLKGQHLRKNNPTVFAQIVSTREQVLRARSTLLSERATLLSDRQSKNWAQVLTDLKNVNTDVESIISLKQQQLTNLQHA